MNIFTFQSDDRLLTAFSRYTLLFKNNHVSVNSTFVCCMLDLWVYILQFVSIQLLFSSSSSSLSRPYFYKNLNRCFKIIINFSLLGYFYALTVWLSQEIAQAPLVQPTCLGLASLSSLMLDRLLRGWVASSCGSNRAMASEPIASHKSITQKLTDRLSSPQAYNHKNSFPRDHHLWIPAN